MFLCWRLELVLVYRVRLLKYAFVQQNDVISFQNSFPCGHCQRKDSATRILFPLEKICTDWQQRQRAVAGLHKLGNACFTSVLLCLTYTPCLANYLLSREHSQLCEHFYDHPLANLLSTSQGLSKAGTSFRRKVALLCQPLQ